MARMEDVNSSLPWYNILQWYSSTAYFIFCVFFFQSCWEKEMQTKTHNSIVLPPGVEVAPEEVLKSTWYNYSNKLFYL